ncbi:MAG: hypothetical protein ABIT58_03185, partial [Ferruginibacter sp.]
MGEKITKPVYKRDATIQPSVADPTNIPIAINPYNPQSAVTSNVNFNSSGGFSNNEFSDPLKLLQAIFLSEDISGIIQQITSKTNVLFDVTAVVIEGVKIPELYSLKEDYDEGFNEIFDSITQLPVGKSLFLEQFIISQESTCSIDIGVQLDALPGNNVLGQLYGRGYREIQVFKLKKDNEILGLLEYFFKTKQTDEQQNIQVISAIIVHAIAEKLRLIFLQQSQHPHSIQLKLSEAVASVRNEKELSTVLINHVNQFISSGSAATILLYDGTQKTFHPWLEGAADDFEKLLPIDLQIANDPFLQHLASSQKALYYNIRELLQDFPQIYIQQAYRAGYVQAMYVPFFVESALKGYIFFYTRQTNGFNGELLLVMQRMVDNIAIVVANILANAELQSRARDKSLLLEISNEMAAIRNKDDLRIVVDEKVKRILLVNNISFCYLNPDGKTFGSFILDEHSPSLKHPEYYKIIMALHPVNDGIADKAIAAELPVVFDIDAVMKWPAIPSYVRMLHEVGMKQLIFSTLRNGDAVIGFLGITRDNKAYIDSNQLHLIKAVSSQLAVALANIKANEQIELQLAEINNYKEQLKEENLYLQE